MDWNWFFSSVAQSAAAIVAIFGGFVITKIINNQTEFQRKCGEVKECIRLCLRLVNEGKAVGFPFVADLSKRGGLHSVEMQIYKDSPVHDAEHYYRTTDFSVYADRQEIIDNINVLIENFKNNPNNPLTRVNVVLNAATFDFDKRKAKESINKFIVDVKTQSLASRTLLEELKSNSYSSPLVTMMIVGIIILFYVGVIYPLSFMPMPTNQEPALSISAFLDIFFSLQGAIMSAVSAIFTLIMIAFVAINLRLKFDREDVDYLEHYSDPVVFSEYLGRAKNNADFRNAAA